MRNYLLFDVVCAKCGSRWLVPASPPDGDLHLFHKFDLSETVALDVYETPLFDEVVAAILEIHNVASRDGRLGSEVHHVISVVSDKDVDRKPFVVLSQMVCPNCGNQALSYGPTEPPKYITASLRQLKHDRWSSLGMEERVAEVRAALENLRG